MSSSSEKACSLHRKACAVRNEKGAQFERNLQIQKLLFMPKIEIE